MKVFVASFALAAAASAEILPEHSFDEARTRLVPEGNDFLLEINDPGNRTWMLQSGDRPGPWTNGPSYRVFNSTLRISLPKAGSHRFFRLNPDLASEVPAATAKNALLHPDTPFNYANPPLPSHFTISVAGSDNAPADNPVTDAGAALGRVLFYDKRLSANRTVSCASCHQAEHGFADPRPLSIGFAGGLTRRNSMGLTNARYYQRAAFLWDERGGNLENQVLMPIQDQVEMGMTLDLLVQRLAAEPFYGELFTTAFGSPEVNSPRIARALAQFIRSITSASSKYDTGRQSDFSNFTALENMGRTLFTVRGCSGCHTTENFITTRLTLNGLENPPIDGGRGEVTGLASDNGKFKVPSLRNIELTAPYMHDGRFATLEEVIEFYNSGIQQTPGLTLPLRSFAQPNTMNLSVEQRAALVAFLKTLTDTSLTSDPKFSDPFRYEAE